ncbi:MAG: hypothetical protein HYW50_03705 [Candidatus Diapherotrites archaeon]|nr:hypothetical protein [Candidatus Diapherotrites archaeon]
MNKKKDRLVDATKRMLESTSEDEIIKSLSDVGLDSFEAKDVVGSAKAGKKTLTEEKHGAAEKKKMGFFGFLFGKKNTQEEKLKKKIPQAKLEKTEKRMEKVFEPPRQLKSESLNFFDTTVTAQVSGFEARSRKTIFREIMPLRVSDFDKLIERGGLKRGDTVLLSGGCGTGKTTFSMQSLYNGALHGERGVYITLEEQPEKMRENLMQNYGWDLEKMEDEQKLAIIKIDPLTIARAVEATLTRERGGLYIELDQFDLPFQFNLPFKPDRVVVDSLSALSIAFMENEQGYRQYLRHLFETLESYNSINIVLGETEQDPGVYSRSGIEEFLADGVIVFYNIKIHNLRQRAMEILKLRSSKHVRKLTPYNIGQHGIEIFINQEIFTEG